MKIKNFNLNQREFETIISYVKNKLNKVSDVGVEILFVRLNSLDKKSLWTLRQAINTNPTSFLILISSSSYIAKFAWKIQVFHFLSYPISLTQLGVLRLKLNEKFILRHDSEKLKMNFKGGFNLIHPKEIAVIKGQGNYCHFFTIKNKPTLYTARIGEIYNLIEDFPYISRVNKSLIINVNQLARINGDIGYFKGSPKVQINLSQRSVKKIKKELLWLD